MGDSTHPVMSIVDVAPLPSEREIETSYNFQEVVNNVVIATATFPFSLPLCTTSPGHHSSL